MTPEAQRIALAEACGWKWVKDTFGDREWWLYPHAEAAKFRPEFMALNPSPSSRDKECGRIFGSREKVPALPDYLNDLNAIYEAVSSLPRSEQWMWFVELAAIVDAEGPAALGSAGQWSEAFLRTIGKWDDNVT